MAAKPKLSTLVTTATSPLLQAADLVTALLKHTHTVSLADMFEKIEARDEAVIAKLALIVMTEDQVSLIESYGTELSLLRNSPSANLTECPVCKSVGVLAGTASRKCTLKLGCEGSPVKSGTAKKVDVPSDPEQPRTPKA